MDGADGVGFGSAGPAGGLWYGGGDASTAELAHAQQQQAIAEARRAAGSGGPKRATTQQRDDSPVPSAPNGGGAGGSPGLVGSGFRYLFGHVDPNQWAAGATAGGIAGGVVGGIAGGAGEGAAGASGGTLVAPGVGTVGGGIAGAAAGAAQGAVVGSAAGAVAGAAVGKAAGQLVVYMAGSSGPARSGHSENGADSGLTRAQQGAVNKVDNIIKNGAKDHDFEGVTKELQGETTGYDHVTEMRNNVRGLRDALASIRGGLENPNLAPEARSQLEAAQGRGQAMLAKMQNALGGNR